MNQSRIHYMAALPFLFVAILLSGACAKSDRFDLVLSNLNVHQREIEISDFLRYGCEVMVVISNDAEDEIKLTCSSVGETPKKTKLPINGSYIFTMRPTVDGESDYWCTLSYRHLWARFDVYSEHHTPYLCPGRKVYRYSVRHDGVYAHPDIDNGYKIRALQMGHNKFSLWQLYDKDNDLPDGLLMTGFVDGGMCSDMPAHFDDKAEAVSICDYQCLYVYDHRRCHGPRQKLQAQKGCQNFRLDESLVHKISAVKGC